MNEKEEMILKILEKMLENRWGLAGYSNKEISRRAKTGAVELEGVRLLFTDPEYREKMFALYVEKEGI